MKKKRNEPGLDVLDPSGEDPGLHVGASSTEEDVVGMPIDGKDSRSDGLLEVLGDPPVVLGIERADGDDSGREGGREGERELNADGQLCFALLPRLRLDEKVFTHRAPEATANLSS